MRGGVAGKPRPARPTHVPAPCAVFASATALTIRRTYRRAAIQCRERNIRTTYRRVLRQPWIASPHFIGTYRKCGGGFAKTVRRDGAPRAGQSPALSRRNAPGRWTGLRPRTARGNHPAAYGGTPPKRGIYGGGRV
ncbi:MAG: hypothetical protein LBM98_07550 [Oscillospiraceae bacterium]|nr:hypothetical protein [Oscillospiraceae bacterium]